MRTLYLSILLRRSWSSDLYVLARYVRSYFGCFLAFDSQVDLWHGGEDKSTQQGSSVEKPLRQGALIVVGTCSWRHAGKSSKLVRTGRLSQNGAGKLIDKLKI